MCKVKSGANINNESDLQNMVIAIILRQNKKYNENDIMETVFYHSKKATIDITPPLIKDMITENLDFLIRNQKVKCMDGIYTPLTIDKF